MHLTGVYELVAVLTHKGRSADSGHYVAWVKQDSGELSIMNGTYSSQGTTRAKHKSSTD